MTIDTPLIIKDWQTGMADSPHLGHALIQCAEIDTFPGAVRVGKQPLTAFHASYTSTFTADPTTDICTATATVPRTGTAVYVSNSGGGLPAGLSANTVYFIINLSSTTFKLATTLANANASTAIDITTAGTGTQTVATVNPGTIKHYARDSRTGRMFSIDSNGRVWTSTSSIYQLLVNSALDTGTGTLTNASGGGLSVFRNSDGSATYLFAFRNAVVDVINVFGTSNVETPSWTNAWKSLNTAAGSANSHHSIVGQDNIVYFVDDRYVGSILEKAGQVFDPANAATYTFNSTALTLPLGSLAYWLEQLDVKLLVSVANDSYIYPWDRSSISYSMPLPLGEYGGNKMKNIGNIVYILAGSRGNIYWTQGTYIRPLKTLPQYVTYNSGTPTSGPVTWGGIAALNGRLLVGVGAGSGNSGVYMLNVSSGVMGVQANAMTLDNFPSTGQANVTAIFAVNEFYEMGYANGSDVFTGSSRYSALGSVVLQSALYRVGTKTTKAKISQVEAQIANGVAGVIRIGYRSDLTSSFTLITDPDTGATTFTTTTSATSYQCDVGIIDIENIQIQVELAASAAIDLLEVRLNP